MSLLNIPATTSQNTAAIIPNGALLPAYLWQYLLSRYNSLSDQGVQGHISHLNLGYVGQIELPLPPLQEQNGMVRVLASTDQKVDAELGALKAFDALFKSLLEQLMSGALRIPPDLVASADAT